MEFPEKINIFTGKRGSPRRHKGKSIYSSSELHPDFLKYLETPEYIKRLSRALEDLKSSDPELFDYFFFRAAGYSFKQIQDTEHFSRAITKPTSAKREHRGEYEPTEYCRVLNLRVTRFLLESIPEDLLKTFSGGEQAISKTLEQSSRNDPERHERVTCPKCGGTTPDCTLCRIKARPWDGTIPKWLFDSYQKRIAEGGTWD